VPEVELLERGRDAYAHGAWADAHEALSAADAENQLLPEDLELLATAAYMLGRDDDHVTVLERAHHAYLEASETLRAARCAFWMGINLILREEMGPATGWLGRAQRLVEREGRECAEQGYLLVPLMVQNVAMGDYDAAHAAAVEGAGLAERYEEPDLFALAVHWQGYARIKQDRVDEGLALLDEAMVAVTAGEVSPIVSGLLYCSVIEGCQEVYAFRRAHEWTTALTRWCERQPDMVAFTGRCLAHRAEIMQAHGAWDDALTEARSAGQRFELAMNRAAAAQALYQEGEVHRLRGDFPAADTAYRAASRHGMEPQPGLALLRLAQGQHDAAVAAIRRVVTETTDPLKRARLLPGFVEIMLMADEVADASAAAGELEDIASRYSSPMLHAMATHARGAVSLAEGDAQSAVVALRRAWQEWEELAIPYEAARARALVGVACGALGDRESGALDLEAARDAFAELGAAPDVARMDELLGRAAAANTHGLTARELEVLRLVAAGKSNRDIAAELVISEHTVARHVQNIFAKLRVSSRTGASAFAFEHGLI
jgi:DNA-binding CsgD family transcriptional regulator